MNLHEARRIWFARQGLLDPRPRSIAQLVAEHGWLRTFGGNAYLSCRARSPRFARRDLDDAVLTDHSLVNVPSVRACVMLVPHADAGLALRAALPAVEKGVARTASRCGFALEEIEDLGRAVVGALAQGAATPDELRERLPPGKIKPLGEAGKKLGESSTLSVTLKLLAARGVVQRLPAHDTAAATRLRYALFAANPASAADLPGDSAAVARALVARYLRWAAPATAEEIGGWTGLGKRAVKAALAALAAQEITIDGREGMHFALPGDRFLAQRPAGKRRFVLLPADDTFMGLRGYLCPLLDVDCPDVKVGGRPLIDPRRWTCHLVVDGGTVVGAWDWHPERRCVVWRAFGKLGDSDRKAIDAEAKAVGTFIGSVLGDLEMSSTDSLASRLTRVVALESIA